MALWVAERRDEAKRFVVRLSCAATFRLATSLPEKDPPQSDKAVCVKFQRKKSPEWKPDS